MFFYRLIKIHFLKFSSFIIKFFLKRFNFKFSKKSFSSIIALLLVTSVALIAVVGFNRWYNHYQSIIQDDLSQQSSVNSFDTKIETLVGNTLYLESNQQNLTIEKVTLNGVDCNLSLNITSGLTKFILPSECLNHDTGSIGHLVIYTDKGILTKEIYIKNYNSLPILYNNFALLLKNNFKSSLNINLTTFSLFITQNLTSIYNQVNLSYILNSITETGNIVKDSENHTIISNLNNSILSINSNKTNLSVAVSSEFNNTLLNRYSLIDLNKIVGGDTIYYTDSTLSKYNLTDPYLDGYRVHVFKNNGYFTISSGLSVIADYLIVGGGGSGGTSQASYAGGGGGGAGGIIFKENVNLSSGSYRVTIGSGGASVGRCSHGLNGGASSFNGLTAYGGGGGGDGCYNNYNGNNGASGGGVGAYYTGTSYPGKAIYGSQGHDGELKNSPWAFGGAGGGAGDIPPHNGQGGKGLNYSYIFGIYVGDKGCFGGGGSSGPNTIGAIGGGGAYKGGSPGTPGMSNTGGGGSGTYGGPGQPYDGSYYPSGAGGSGTVVIRYRVANSIKYDNITTYQLKDFKIQKVISYSKLTELKELYYNNYSYLKNMFNFPTDLNFAILSNNIPEINMLPTEGIPSNLTITSDDDVYEVLRNDGTLVKTTFFFKIWNSSSLK